MRSLEADSTHKTSEGQSSGGAITILWMMMANGNANDRGPHDLPCAFKPHVGHSVSGIRTNRSFGEGPSAFHDPRSESHRIGARRIAFSVELLAWCHCTR